MKKIFSLILTGAIVTSMCSQVFAATPKFSDISEPKYSWAKDYIIEMAEKGYINGYDDGTYRPDNEVTRLETIALFARAMGALNPENEEIVEYAKDKYSNLLNELDMDFGDDEVAYLLYRGILTQEDAKTFLTKSKANKPMPRQEAAAIITKTLCGEKDAKAEVLTDMEFTDAKTIDSDYTQYVFYASENGIMQGMDDGSYFSPKTSVLRSQIAVMLYRTSEKMNLYIEKAMVSDLDVTNNNITIVDTENADVPVGYTDDTKFFIENKIKEDEDFVVNSEAMLTYINDELVFVDMYDIVVDETKKAIYQGLVTKGNKTTVSFKDVETEEVTTYDLSLNPNYYDQNGNTTQKSNFKLGSYVEYSLSNDRIIQMSLLDTESYILGATVKSVDIEDDLYLTISHDDEEYDGMKFLLTDDVLVYKNDDREDLSMIYVGDKLDITLEYGIVTKLRAKSNTQVYSGVIAEVTISQTPVIQIKIDGEIQKFEVVPTATIIVDDKEATLYDLRVGDSVKVTAESGVILKINTTAAAISSNPVTGVIEVVNASKGFIKIDGETIFCNDTITKFVSADGANKAMRDLQAGMTVSVRGSTKNGAYNATLIIIEK